MADVGISTEMPFIPEHSRDRRPVIHSTVSSALLCKDPGEGGTRDLGDTERRDDIRGNSGI